MLRIGFVSKVHVPLGIVIGLLCLVIAPFHRNAQAGQMRGTGAFPAELALRWFDLQRALVRSTPGYTPPVASRTFGYTGVTLYEAVIGGMPDHRSLVGQLNGLPELPQPDAEADYQWAVVANSALAQATRLLFPTASDDGKVAIDELYATLLAEFQQAASPEVIERSNDYGIAVADAIYAWSMTDGGYDGQARNFPTDYVAPVGDGLWIPTPRSNGSPLPAMQPTWGDNRPFVLASGQTCMPPAPPAYTEDSASAFYAEALEVYETQTTLTSDQQAIALFWADDLGATATPPGHSISILTQILAQEDTSLAFAAEAYARLGIAMSDAFIGCWHTKYVYNLVRPVTVIQRWIDETWLPIVDTPPFPEYPSGHSVQIGAASAVLASLFGESYAFTDHTHDDRGLPARSYTSFSQMAEEAALSRLYGGIHYRSAIERGLEQGQCIGAQVNELILKQALA
jgi:hypothetical protein